MKTLTVGQTWYSSCGNCWRIVRLLDNERVEVKRIAIMGSDYAVRIAGETYTWLSESLDTPSFRMISGNASAFDKFLSSQPCWK